MFDVSDGADDFLRGSGRSRDALAERVFVGELLARELLVNDGDERGALCVLRVEESAFDELDAHCSQVIRAGVVEHRLRLLARFGLRPPLDGEGSVGRADERQSARHGRRLDARQFSDSLLQLIEEIEHLGALIALRRA